MECKLLPQYMKSIFIITIDMFYALKIRKNNEIIYLKKTTTRKYSRGTHDIGRKPDESYHRLLLFISSKFIRMKHSTVN